MHFLYGNRGSEVCGYESHAYHGPEQPLRNHELERVLQEQKELSRDDASQHYSNYAPQEQ